MKKILALAAVLFIGLSATSFAAVSVKGGLAGGGGRIAVSSDLRQIRPDVGLSGELGYAIGNSYSILTAGVGVAKELRDNLAVGLLVTYSSYSEKVRLILPTIDITEKSGVGGELFVKMTRDKMYGIIGYDARLGVIAEAGLVVRM